MRKVLFSFMLIAVGLLISGNLRADNEVCQIGTTKYATLQEAFNAAENGQTVQMIADVNETGKPSNYMYAVLSKEGQNVVLDLAGHTISVEVSDASNATCIRVEGNTTLTIRDSKKNGLMKLKDNASASWKYSSSVIWNQGTLTIDVDENTKFWNATTVNGIDYVIDNQIESGRPFPVNCTVNGGTFQCDANPIMRLYEQHGEYIVQVTIEDGEFIGQRCFLFQKARPVDNSQIELNVKGGTYIARQNDKDYRFIDSQFDFATSSLKKVTVNIGNKEGEKQPNITGFLYLAGGGSNAAYSDYQTKGLETVNIYGGIFNTPNPIQIPNAVGSEQEVIEYVKDNNLWKVYGGQFVFDEKPYDFKVIDAIQLEQHDAKGNYAVDPTGFYKHYGMATEQNWNDLGYYLVENKNTGKEGTWYSVMKMKSGSDAYDNFKNLIDKTKAGVKETVQGTIRNVNVIPVHGADQKIITETTWSTTDAGSQVVLEGEGAIVTIPAGKTVEAYSVTVPTGSTLNVENGATLIVGAGGVTGANDKEAISINIGSDEKGSGAIKISPDADPSVATPRVRVKLTTKAHAEGEGDNQVYHWQYFARPTGIDPESFTVVYNPAEGGATKHFIYGYNGGATESYKPIADFKSLANYQGYAITNDSKNGGVVYQFEGKLNANKDAEIKFENSNFTLLGNSYLAPVSMDGLFAGIRESETPTTAMAPRRAAAENGSIEYTIWLYDHDQKRFVQTNQLQASRNKAKAQLQPMQGFFMRLMEGSSLTTKIDYVGAVWNNNAQAGPILAPARNHDDMAAASIVVSANGCADQIDLFEDVEFDDSFNNGADASKLMNLTGMFNLYAQTEAGTLSCVASDDVEGTILTFQANKASEYVLSFKDVANMDYSLIDLKTNAVISMDENSVYSFEATPNSTESRFQIVRGKRTPTDIESVSAAKAATGIYSMTGAYLGEADAFHALPAGVYVVNGEKIVK